MISVTSLERDPFGVGLFVFVCVFRFHCWRFAMRLPGQIEEIHGADLVSFYNVVPGSS